MLIYSTQLFELYCKKGKLTMPFQTNDPASDVTILIDGQPLPGQFTSAESAAWVKVLRGQFPEASIDSISLPAPASSAPVSPMSIIYKILALGFDLKITDGGLYEFRLLLSVRGKVIFDGTSDRLEEYLLPSSLEHAVKYANRDKQVA